MQLSNKIVDVAYSSLLQTAMTHLSSSPLIPAALLAQCLAIENVHERGRALYAALVAHPESPELLAAYGFGLANSKRPHLALMIIDEALAAFPDIMSNNPDVRHAQAFAALINSNPSLASECAEIGLKTAKGRQNPKLNYLYLEALLQQKNSAKALTWLDNTFTDYPQHLSYLKFSLRFRGSYQLK